MTEPSVLRELSPDERVVWSAQPDASKVFGPFDFFLVPFSLLWAGGAFFWEATVLGWNPLLPIPEGHAQAPFAMALAGIPFVLIGAYLLFGRFIYASWIKKRTHYVLTNKRILVIIDGFSKKVRSQDLKSLPKLEKIGWAGDRGDLYFGDLVYGFSHRGRLRTSGYNSSNGPLAFFDVHEVAKVHDLINQQKEAAQ